MKIPGVRINDLHMTTKDVVLAMCGGNPGAITACMEILAHEKYIDPGAFTMASLLDLDMLHVYDDRIYMLWNDVCHRNVGLMIAVLRAKQLGHIDERAINIAIDNRGKGINLDLLVRRIQEELPNFNPDGRAPLTAAAHPAVIAAQAQELSREDDDKKRDKYEAVKV